MGDKVIRVMEARHSSAELAKRYSFVEQIANNQFVFTRSNSVPECRKENLRRNSFKLHDSSKENEISVLEAVCDDLSLVSDW